MKNHLMMWLHVSDDLFCHFSVNSTRHLNDLKVLVNIKLCCPDESGISGIYVSDDPAAGISKFAKHVVNILHFTQGANKWTVLRRRICVLSDHKVHIYYWIDFDMLMPAACEQRESKQYQRLAQLDWEQLTTYTHALLGGFAYCTILSALKFFFLISFVCPSIVNACS